jgi:Protein of unknown function (DUF3137)
MAAPKDFNEFYDTELKQQLLPFEDLRSKVVRFGVLGFILIILAFISFAVASATQQQYLFVLFFIFLLAGITVVVIFYNKRKDYIAGFKENIVYSIIKFIDPSLQYNPNGHISRNDYKNSGLYLKQPDRYNGDDYVEGRRDKTIFCFSELHTEYEESSGKNTSWHTIFKGLFFVGDFNKNFQGRTYVYSETNPQLGYFTKLFSSFAWNLEKVKLESAEFENKFVVYSSDQVEARYILTPSFMERLVKLQEMMGDETSYSFVDTNVYVAVPMRDSLFEPSVFSPNNYNKLGDYYNTVHIIFDIIDELNLNLRIWTKE